MKYIIIVMIMAFGEGRTASVNKDIWTANTDTEPLKPQEYPLLIFQTKFTYARFGQVKTGIDDMSPLLCYDGEIKCGDRLEQSNNKWPREASEIIQEMR